LAGLLSFAAAFGAGFGAAFGAGLGAAPLFGPGLGGTISFPFASAFAQEVVAGIRDLPVPPLQRRRPDLPPALIDLIAALLAKDSAARPSAEEASKRFRSLAH